MVLYIFITHQSNLNNCYSRIKEMMIDDFIIVEGGNIADVYDHNTKILKLNCNDTYIGLTEKVMKTFHFIMPNKEFGKYTHFIKLDDDVEVVKKFDCYNIKELDYFGAIMYRSDGNYNRRWHMGKTNTYWDRIPYQGEYKPFCSGGFGYGVSRRALDKFIPNFDYITNIYEDVNMALLMDKHGIKPTDISDIREFLKSPKHISKDQVYEVPVCFFPNLAN